MRVLASPAPRRIALLVAAIVACGALGACESPAGSDPDPIPFELTLEVVASGLDRPLYLTAPPGDARLFVVEQPGRVRIVDATGSLVERPFLDLSDSVTCCGERGLLSIAFHPGYASSGFLFASYTGAGGESRVERYTISADPDSVDAESGVRILSVDQPFSNHNGGLVTFGPDGKLYVALGDGGSANDPQGNGQNLATLLGSLLRLDVDGDLPYEIPDANPFLELAGARGEIWAYGLRNPWRFSFDAEGGDLWIADVGQNQWEEVNRVRADLPGANYGWKVMEGTHCFQATPCSSVGLVLPVGEYSHDDGCSVTGGFVYRGALVPELEGWYLFADYCSGWIRTLPPGWPDESESGGAGGGPAAIREWNPGTLGLVTSFGADANRELYLVTRDPAAPAASNGTVYRIVGASGLE